MWRKLQSRMIINVDNISLSELKKKQANLACLIRSGLFQTANNPGGGGGGALKDMCEIHV